MTTVDLLRDASVRTGALEAWVAAVVGEITPSVQLAVYRDERLAASIASGVDARRGLDVTRRSLFNLYSSTKLFQCLCMLHLHDRGYFDWDDPVAKHWPEFAQNGKDGVTIRHVLSHRAGMAVEPAGTTWTWWGDRAEVARRMETMGLKWEPGARQGYHNRTCGFLCDTLAWQWTGRGIGELLREWVFEPLRIDDFWFGVPRAVYDERVVLTETRASGPLPARSRDEFRPFIGGEANLFNSFELLSLPLTWGTAVTSAERAAEVACFFAGKGLYRAARLFSPDVFDVVTTCQSLDGETDETLGRPVRWGLGPQLGPFADVFPDAIGHGGGATVHVWASASERIAAACILGGVRKAARWQDGFARAVHADLVQ